MQFTRFAMIAPFLAIGFSGCEPAAPNPNDAACGVAVIKALELLPSDVKVDVAQIQSGRSGDKLSCKVTGSQANIMIDATLTCVGNQAELEACTTIDGITTLTDDVLYPLTEGTDPEG